MTQAEQDRAGRLMAWLVNPQRWGTSIVEIINADGLKVHTQHKINKAFAYYYTQLYAACAPRNEGYLRAFLSF